MKKLHLLILKTFIGPFLITTVFVTFIFVTQRMVVYMEELVNKGIEFALFAELAFYFSFFALPRALPLAILLSSLMTYGNLGQHNELTAIKSSGVSLIRIISPVFVVVVFISIGLYVFNDQVLPETNKKAYALLHDMRQKKPALNLQEGVFYSAIPGYSIRVMSKEEDGQRVKGVMIYDHSSNQGNVDVTVADSGRMYTVFDDSYLVLELHNGVKSSEYREQKTHYNDEYTRSYFDFSKVYFDLSSFKLGETDENAFRHSRQVMSGNQLMHYADSAFVEEKNNRRKLKPSLLAKYRYMPLDSASFGGHDLAKNSFGAEVEVRDINNALSQARSIKTFLRNRERTLFEIRKKRIRYLVEFFHNYTESLVCLTMFLIGASVGAILKKGGLGIPVLVTIVFFILHYVVDISVEKLARVEEVDVFYGVWVGNVVLLPIGLYFLGQARRDSSMFEVDYYKRLMKKFTGLFGIIQKDV